MDQLPLMLHMRLLVCGFHLVSVRFFSSDLCVKNVLLLWLMMIHELDLDSYTGNKF